ncbi:MAG: hypothetical protein WBC83_00235 [Minisyncoccia bacterium]
MRIRSLPRNRENRSRNGTPNRPNQEVIEKKKLARLKPWVRIAIEKACEAGEEAFRRQAFYLKKGWVTAPQSPS